MSDLYAAPLDRQIALDDLRLAAVTKQLLRDNWFRSVRRIQLRRLIIDRPSIDEDVDNSAHHLAGGFPTAAGGALSYLRRRSQ